MNTNLTEVVFIIDESGSMYPFVSDTIGGYNTFLRSQKEVEGEANITTVFFSDKLRTFHDRKNLKDVRELRHDDYRPFGCTSLYDAVGSTIDHIGSVLAATPEDQRPGHVIFVIITDGYENSSREYTQAMVKNRIEHQREKYSWEFVFLGADMDAEHEAESIGIHRDFAATYSATSIGTTSVYASMDTLVKEVRSNYLNGCIDNSHGKLSDEWKKSIQ